MRVLLIRVPAFRHVTENSRSLAPFGLSVLAAALRDDHEVRILDGEVGQHRQDRGGGFYRLGKSDAEIGRAIEEFAPEVIGISCMFANALPALEQVSAVARAHAPDAVLVAGGYAASTDPEVVLPHVDHAILGEGEFTFPRLLDQLARGERPERVWQQEWESDLDRFPFPAYDLLDLDDYREHEVAPDGLPGGGDHLRAAGLMTSRGCPVGCNFCSVQFVTGTPFRRATAKRVVDDVIRLRDEFGVQKIHFFDDNLTLNRKHALAIFQELIDREANVAWNTTQGTAAWNWDEEMLEKAVESGLQYLILPVESGDERVLQEVMHKTPLKLFKLEDLIVRARQRGLGMQAWAIIGSPGETKAEMERTLAYMNELDVDYRGIATATPYPGSDLYAECEEKGYVETPIDFSRLQRCVSVLNTPEWSARYVTARAAAWTLNGRLRTGQGLVRAVRRCYEAHGLSLTAYALFLAWRERRSTGRPVAAASA
jgi:radical SAM superfamily enzyme YgiQ (UPF0313 family)